MLNRTLLGALCRLAVIALCLPAGAAGCKDDAAREAQAPAPAAGAQPDKGDGVERAIRPPYASNFEVANGDVISGWVWDSTRPNVPLEVDVYDGETLLGTYTADVFRQDLLDGGIGDGRHSFSVPTPERLKDGRPHSVAVTLSKTKTQLGNSPRTLQHP